MVLGNACDFVYDDYGSHVTIQKNVHRKKKKHGKLMILLII